MHRLVQILLLQLKIIAFHHHTSILTTCIQATISQVMLAAAAAFNLQIITIISHLPIRCKIITTPIALILNFLTAICIKILVHHIMQVIILTRHHHLHRQIFHRHHRALTIINGIISNL